MLLVVYDAVAVGSSAQLPQPGRALLPWGMAVMAAGAGQLAQLVSLTEGPSILVDKPILLIGRHPECDIQIESRKLSRRHCCIPLVDDHLVVRDLGSTNGVRINGVRVLEGRLNPGDELTIGNNRFQVRWEGVPVAAPAAPRAREAAPVGKPPRVADDLLEDAEDPVP